MYRGMLCADWVSQTLKTMRAGRKTLISGRFRRAANRDREFDGTVDPGGEAEANWESICGCAAERVGELQEPLGAGLAGKFELTQGRQTVNQAKVCRAWGLDFIHC